MNKNKIPDSGDSQRLANQLCHRFYVISNAITRAYRPLLDETDLTYPQYVVMMALWEEDDLSISELQQKTLIDTGCLSLMLKKMRSKGVIELSTSQTDRRVKKVVLTEKGAALKATTQKARDEFRQTQQPVLTDAELQQLTDLLDKLKAGLVTKDGA